MKILVLFYSSYPYSSGGRETAFYNLSKRLKPKGYDFKLITIRPRGSPEKIFPVAPDELVTIPSVWVNRKILWGPTSRLNLFVYPWLGTFAMRGLFRSESLDVVLAMDPGASAMLGAFVKRRYQIPLAISYRSAWSEEVAAGRWQFLHPLFYRIENYVLKKADLILANGRDTVELLRQKGVPSSKLKLLLNGVDTSFFAPENEDRFLSSPRGDSEFTLVSVASLRDLKGISHLIRALSYISSDVLNNLKLLVVGKGDQRRYEQLSSRLGLEQRIDFLGEVRYQDLPTILNQAHLAVFPGLMGVGLSHSALEALACGVPVVAYDYADFSTIVKDKVTVFLVPQGEVRELAKKIEYLYGDWVLLKAMSTKARQMACSFDWGTIADNLALCLEEVKKSYLARRRK